MILRLSTLDKVAGVTRREPTFEVFARYVASETVLGAPEQALYDALAFENFRTAEEAAVNTGPDRQHADVEPVQYDLCREECRHDLECR